MRRSVEALSRTDSMTNLLNQRAFREELRMELIRVQRRSSKLSLIYFDIDNFKIYNDTEGHQKGDAILKSIGQLLLGIKREIDLAGRMGGDEFCIALPDVDSKGANEFYKRLTQTLQEQNMGVTLSIGTIQNGPEDYFDVDEIIQKADGKMYEAKINRSSNKQG